VDFDTIKEILNRNSDPNKWGQVSSASKSVFFCLENVNLRIENEAFNRGTGFFTTISVLYNQTLLVIVEIPISAVPKGPAELLQLLWNEKAFR
jgi:hypothetical protein